MGVGVASSLLDSAACMHPHVINRDTADFDR